MIFTYFYYQTSNLKPVVIFHDISWLLQDALNPFKMEGGSFTNIQRADGP